ncbi:response regulator [Roseibacterium sp. SDUM158017]|uniref:response regulator n=1 Tax=Roseicyclus salinarum TaxID=3036773 RepID=UPI0024154726|nr:response regulator [Roseibacterium sp. SDUM158017]MDG4650646.1 response regulator [Roseibacterium sp. SDUM158017]
MDQRDGSLQSVLIVDSDAVVRASLSTYLRDCGLRAIEASDTSEAKAVLTQDEPQIDIILCDTGTIGTEPGFSFAQWVRTNRQDVPVLLAGNVDNAASLAGDLCEEGPQLAKPYDPSLVVDAIRQALARRDQFSGS